MKPILFNTEMVRATLDGRKTVTRRVVRLKYSNTHLEMRTDKYGTRLIELQNEEPGVTTIRNPDGTTTHRLLAAEEKARPYCPGDILWVRETWNGDWCDHYIYKADGGSAVAAGYASEPKWHPSIHMPKEAARLFLRVSGVRVERLQDSFTEQGDTITALRDEGVDIGDHCRQCIENYGNPCCNDLDPDLEPDDNGEDENGGSECGMLDEVRSDFARLWDNTLKPADRALYGWEANPWVWVIEFERISKEAALKEAEK